MQVKFYKVLTKPPVPKTQRLSRQPVSPELVEKEPHDASKSRNTWPHLDSSGNESQQGFGNCCRIEIITPPLTLAEWTVWTTWLSGYQINVFPEWLTKG